jgi:hypothetical protein
MLSLDIERLIWIWDWTEEMKKIKRKILEKQNEEMHTTIHFTDTFEHFLHNNLRVFSLIYKNPKGIP